MSDEPIALEPPRSSILGKTNLIGTLAFLGGIAVALGAVELAGGFSRQPAPQAILPQIAAPVGAPNGASTTDAPRLAIASPSTDVASFDAHHVAMATRLDDLEKRLRDVDDSTRTASAYATQAERLMVAFAVRRAIERGQPIGILEPQLRSRFGEGEGEAVATLVQASAEPVTLEDLRLALNALGQRLIFGDDEGFFSNMHRRLSDLVVVRPADAPSPRAGDRLRRAQHALDSGDVERALAEVAHMPGVSAATNWTSAAKRYVQARHALNQIERAAMNSPAAPPPPTE